MAVFVDTLRILGWVEGTNIAYEFVYADGNEAQLPALAVELVAKRPDLIFANTNAETRAALAATSTIPVIFGAANDPVGYGVVKSLARPGGNATGVAALGRETGAKRMQLLRETMPKVSRVGVVMMKTPALEAELKMIEQAAGTGVRVISTIVDKRPADWEASIAFLERNRAEVALLTNFAISASDYRRIIGSAMKYRIPVIAPRSAGVENGALLSYNSNLDDHFRRAAQLADKVLKGATPGDLPVEQPTKFDLVINMKTAKALGISIPRPVLLQATRVIE